MKKFGWRGEARQKDTICMWTTSCCYHPSSLHPPSLYFKKPHPAQVRKLVYVGMEHVFAGKVVLELQYAPVALGQRNYIVYKRRCFGCAAWIILEHVAVQVEVVHRVKLKHVHKVDTVWSALLRCMGWFM